MNFTLSRDVNGNKTLRVTVTGARAATMSRRRSFSIQTLGALPETHRHGIGPWTRGEVFAYVHQFGTAHQKNLLSL